MIFEEEKMDTCRVVPNCYRTPIPKFHFEIMLLFIVTQGLAGPHTMLTVTLKSAMTTNSKNQGVLGENVFFDLFELKMTRNIFLCPSQNSFCHAIWGPTIILPTFWI